MITAAWRDCRLTPEDWNHWAVSGTQAVVRDAEVEYFEQVVHPKSGMTAVDLACGTGQWTRQLAAWGMTVTGYDYADEALREAEATDGGTGPSYTLWDIVAEPIPGELVPGQVDVVTCRYGLPYLEPGRLLTDIGRWLKPDGVFYALVRVGDTSGHRNLADLREDDAQLDHLPFDLELLEESIAKLGSGWAHREVHPMGTEDRAIVLRGYDPPVAEHLVPGEPASRACRAVARQPTAAQAAQTAPGTGLVARSREMP